MRIPILFNYFLSIFVVFLFIYRYPRNHEGSFPPLKETMTTRSLRRIIASLSGSHECWIINRCCSYWIGCIQKNNTLEKFTSFKDQSSLLKLYGTAKGTHVWRDAPTCWYNIQVLCKMHRITTVKQNILRRFSYVLLLLVWHYNYMICWTTAKIESDLNLNW